MCDGREDATRHQGVDGAAVRAPRRRHELLRRLHLRGLTEHRRSYLGILGAGALAVGVVAGFGELLGYALRLFSGRIADRPGGIARSRSGLFERAGIGILVPLTVVGAMFAPLVFLGGFWAGLVGVSLWGLGMGVHESIIPAAVAPMVSPDRRASAYGIFTGVYGIAWFLGSVVIGAAARYLARRGRRVLDPRRARRDPVHPPRVGANPPSLANMTPAMKLA